MINEPNLDKIASEQASHVAKALLSAAKEGGTEADFRRKAARILEDVGSIAGLTIVPRDEFSVARGRVDSVYNRLILEYKRPGILRPTNVGTANKGVIEARAKRGFSPSSVFLLRRGRSWRRHCASTVAHMKWHVKVRRALARGTPWKAS